MTRLPKRSLAQVIGVRAAALLDSTLTKYCNVCSIPQEKDLGIDFLCELLNEQEPTGKLFFVQCKGKDKIDDKEDEIIIQIKVSTLNYWLLQPLPVFVIVVDISKKHFYWTLPKTLIETFNNQWQHQEKVSIKVSKQYIFTEDSNELPQEFISVVETYIPDEYKKISEELNALKSLVNLSTNRSLKIAPGIQMLVQIGENIKDIASSLAINDEQMQEINIDRIRQEIQKYKLLIQELDCRPSFNSFRVTSSISTEPFIAGCPKDVINNLENSLARFTIEPSKENYFDLLKAFGQLLKLNKDIAYVIDACLSTECFMGDCCAPPIPSEVNQIIEDILDLNLANRYGSLFAFN